MSGALSVPNSFANAVTATGLQLDNNFGTITAYINDPTNRNNYAADSSGATNTIALSFSPAVTGYSAGLQITFKAAIANTGAVVVNANSLGNKNLFSPSGASLNGGEIASGQVVVAGYDGTQFQMISQAANVSPFPTGTMVPYSGSSAPSGWLLCFGQPVSRTTFSVLFVTIGTTYGAGDGSTTFNVPDLRGRAPFGKDDMGGTAALRITGAISGVTATVLGSVGGDQRSQSHTHGPGGGNAFIDTVISGGGSGFGAGSDAISRDGATGTSGLGLSQNMPPAIILNYIIKT